MTTPSLQDVLAAVPAVADQIDGMTELAPGVPANAENLRTLWKHVQHVNTFDSLDVDGMRVLITTTSCRKGEYQELLVTVKGPPENYSHNGHTFQTRPNICDESNKNTSEGLLQCLLFARRSLKRYRDEGPCPACCTSDVPATGVPVKKLKATGMPRCADCTLTAVIGMSEGACKRAWHSP